MATDPSPTPDPPATSRSTVLAHELGGSLPCARCRYDLRGLSVRGICPECTLPIRATLLAVVDPLASELRPLRHPRLASWGVVVWSGAALGACLLTWTLRAAPHGVIAPWAGALGLGVVALAVLSGLAALVFVRPHDGPTARRGSLSAALGCLAYGPFAWVLFRLLVQIDPAGGRPYGTIYAGSERLWLAMVGHVLLVAIVLGLRHNARDLWVRSLILRSGLADRQTLLAIAAALAPAILGDVLRRVAIGAAPDSAQILDQLGQLLILLGSALFTLGVLGLLLDSLRLRPVLAAPPLSMEGVLHGTPRPKAPKDPSA